MEEEQAEPTPPRPGLILVIAEDPDVYKRLDGVLCPAGHTLDLADDLDQALEKLGARRYDLIVADIDPSGTSGTQVLETLKRRHPDTEVVAMTDRSDLDEAGDILSRGVQAYFNPYGDPDHIQLMVDWALGRQAHRVPSEESEAEPDVQQAPHPELWSYLQDIGSKTDAFLEYVHERFEDLEERLQRQEEHTQEQGEQFAHVTAAMDGLKQSVTQIEERTQGIEGQLSRLNDLLTQTQAELQRQLHNQYRWTIGLLAATWVPLLILFAVVLFKR